MKRPRIRTVFRGLGMMLGVLVLLALAGSLALRVYGDRRLARARSALEQQGVSLSLASYELPEVPKEENAAVWFQAGAAAVVLSREDRTLMFASARLPSQEWDDERTQRVRALLAVNHGALETLHRGAPLSRSSFEVEYRKGASARMPGSGLRTAAGLVVAEGRLALRDGNEQVFLLAESTVSRLADAMTREPVLITQIEGDYVEKHALFLAVEVVAGAKDFPHALARLGDALPTGDRLAELRRSLGCEAAMMSTMFDAGRELDDLLVGPDGSWHTLSLLNASGYARLIHAALVEASLRQRTVIDAPLETLLAFAWQRPLRSRWPHRWLAETLSPVAGRVALETRLTLAARQLVRAAIDVRAAGLRDGRYPATAPDGTAFSQPNALNGRPLRYTRDGSGSARIEIPGVTAKELWDAHGRPLLGLDLPAPRAAKAHGAVR
jgi:hypothetical protein